MCFDSPSKEVLLRTLLFSSLNEMSRCLNISRPCLTNFVYNQPRPYRPVKGPNIHRLTHLLACISVEKATVGSCVSKRQITLQLAS